MILKSLVSPTLSNIEWTRTNFDTLETQSLKTTLTARTLQQLNIKIRRCRRIKRLIAGFVYQHISILLATLDRQIGYC